MANRESVAPNARNSRKVPIEPVPRSRTSNHKPVLAGGDPKRPE